jgi:outer membrane protein insertion porin family
MKQTLSLGLRSGILYPLGGSPSLFPDRMHLGGPTSVRMFRPNAMGPKDSGMFLHLVLICVY